MRTHYCSYCSLWSQRDFCNRLERSRTWEPFILLSSSAWGFISSNIVTSGFAGMGKSIWARNRDCFFILHQGVQAIGQSFGVVLHLAHSGYIYFSSDLSLEGNTCSTLSLPVAHHCVGVICGLEWVHRVSSGEQNPREGRWAHKTFDSRRWVWHRAVLTQRLPPLAPGMLQQPLDYCFHTKAFPSRKQLILNT